MCGQRLTVDYTHWHFCKTQITSRCLFRPLRLAWNPSMGLFPSPACLRGVGDRAAVCVQRLFCYPIRNAPGRVNIF